MPRGVRRLGAPAGGLEFVEMSLADPAKLALPLTSRSPGGSATDLHIEDFMLLADAVAAGRVIRGEAGAGGFVAKVDPRAAFFDAGSGMPRPGGDVAAVAAWSDLCTAERWIDPERFASLAGACQVVASADVELDVPFHHCACGPGGHVQRVDGLGSDSDFDVATGVTELGLRLRSAVAPRDAWMTAACRSEISGALPRPGYGASGGTLVRGLPFASAMTDVGRWCQGSVRRTGIDAFGSAPDAFLHLVSDPNDPSVGDGAALAPSAEETLTLLPVEETVDEARYWERSVHNYTTTVSSATAAYGFGPAEHPDFSWVRLPTVAGLKELDAASAPGTDTFFEVDPVAGLSLSDAAGGSHSMSDAEFACGDPAAAGDLYVHDARGASAVASLKARLTDIVQALLFEDMSTVDDPGHGGPFSRCGRPLAFVYDVHSGYDGSMECVYLGQSSGGAYSYQEENRTESLRFNGCFSGVWVGDPDYSGSGDAPPIHVPMLRKQSYEGSEKYRASVTPRVVQNPAFGRYFFPGRDVFVSAEGMTAQTAETTLHASFDLLVPSGVEITGVVGSFRVYRVEGGYRAPAIPYALGADWHSPARSGQMKREYSFTCDNPCDPRAEESGAYFPSPDGGSFFDDMYSCGYYSEGDAYDGRRSHSSTTYTPDVDGFLSAKAQFDSALGVVGGLYAKPGDTGKRTVHAELHRHYLVDVGPAPMKVGAVIADCSVEASSLTVTEVDPAYDAGGVRHLRRVHVDAEFAHVPLVAPARRGSFVHMGGRGTVVMADGLRPDVSMAGLGGDFLGGSGALRAGGGTVELQGTLRWVEANPSMFFRFTKRERSE